MNPGADNNIYKSMSSIGINRVYSLLTQNLISLPDDTHSIEGDSSFACSGFRMTKKSVIGL